MRFPGTRVKLFFSKFIKVYFGQKLKKLGIGKTNTRTRPPPPPQVYGHEIPIIKKKIADTCRHSFTDTAAYNIQSHKWY